MIKINREIEKKLKELDINQVGSFFEGFGAFTDDETEFILYYKDNGVYLAHISEFERMNDLFIRLKNPEPKKCECKEPYKELGMGYIVCPKCGEVTLPYGKQEPKADEIN